jgi:hypothetical protein
MSSKNITKKISFVTILLLFCLNLSGCNLLSAGSFNGSNQNAGNTNKEFSAEYQKPEIVGIISSPEITESSGIVASRCNAGVLWTHNDSGDSAFIFALDAGGKKLGTWKVQGAKNYDWEDIATFKTPGGECFLYIGDIGNNARTRGDFIVYRVKEPTVSADTNSSKKNPLSTAPAEAIKIDYPDMRHDAETLMVHPQTGDIYILTKRLSGASGVYKLAANYSRDKTNRLEKIADFSVPAIPNGFLTGGDISPDGKHVVLSDYFAAYEITLPAAAKNFDEIWKEKPIRLELGERKQGEAVGYSADGRAIFATSEGKKSPLIKIERR